MLILESIDIPPRAIDLPLRMSVTNILKGSRTNVANVVGRIESGVLQLGDSVVFQPGGERGIVKGDLPAWNYDADW